MASALGRVWQFLSPARASATNNAEAAITTSPSPTTTQAHSTPVTPDLEPDLEQDVEQPPPRSLFSNKPSAYLPGSQKRKFELDFELPQTTKKAKLEVMASFKRKREFGPQSSQKKSKPDDMSEIMPDIPHGLEALASSKRKREDEPENVQKKSKPDDMSQIMPDIPRSAMKRRYEPSTPTTTMKKSVTFFRQPLTSTKTVRPMFGKAGHYTGSVFADVSPVSPSSPEATPSTPSTTSDISPSQLEQSPTTKSNTQANTPIARVAYCRDPHDPYWRPQPHNPKPGMFCLPDDLSYLDEIDDENDGDVEIGGNDESNANDKHDKSTVEESTSMQPDPSAVGHTTTTPETIRKGYNAVFPNSPETPKMSHAQLPATTPESIPTATANNATPPKDPYMTPPIARSNFAEAGSDAVNKARAAAEKYKPESIGKQASKLSQVTQARSRSSSPSGSRSATPRFVIDPALVAHDKEQMRLAQENEINIAGNATPHELEQLDQWARNLEWPQPGQKIVEEEVFKSDMMGHILQEWNEDDDEQSEMFWNREFGRVVEAGRRAERGGKVLMFV